MNCISNQDGDSGDSAFNEPQINTLLVLIFRTAAALSDCDGTKTGGGMLSKRMQNDERRIALLQFSLAFSSSKAFFKYGLIIAVLMVLSLWHLVGHGVLLVWLGAICLVSSVGYFQILRYLSKGLNADVNPGGWKPEFVFGSAVLGLCWGCAALLFPVTPFDPTSDITILFIAAISAFASVAMACMPAAAFAFLLNIMVPLIVWLFSFGERTHTYMALIILVYLGMMLLLVRQMRGMSLALRSSTEQNNELMVAMQEEELRKSMYFENAPGFFCTATLHAKGYVSMPFATQQVGELLGINNDELTRSIASLISILNVEDVLRLQVAMNASLQSLVPFNAEFRINHEIKGERWVEFRSLPQRGLDGETCWYGFMQDITERVRASEASKEDLARITALYIHLDENTKALEENARSLEEQAVELEASQEQLKLTEAWYRSILQSAPDGMVVVNSQGVIILANSQLEKVFGYAEGELVGHGIEILLPVAFRQKHQDIRADFVQKGTSKLPFEDVKTLKACRKDGLEFPIDVSLSRLPDTAECVGAICASIRDVSERKRNEISLAKREREFRTLAENTQDSIVRFDHECRIVYSNPRFVELMGIQVEAIVGKTPWQLQYENNSEIIGQLVRELIHDGKVRQFEHKWQANGVTHWGMVQMVPEYSAAGKVETVLVVTRDITKRKMMEESIAAREREARVLIDNSLDTIIRYDRDCRRIFVNPAFASMIAGGAAAALGKKPSEYPGGELSARYEQKILGVFASGESDEMEYTLRIKDDSEICLLIRLVAERDENGGVSTVIGFGRDITERVAYKQKIHQMAFFDSLTSLPNRALFNDRLRRMLMDASRNQQIAGVMLLDLDRFKAVNDTLGHPAGDELLREAAARLAGCVRANDTVARLGGDEFAILLPEIRSVDNMGKVANKILAAFTKPFLLEGREVFVSTSIGIAVYPNDSGDADDLVKQADSAMYLAKRSGRNNFRYYSEDLTASASERLTLESELRRALERNELELHYQPKILLADGTVTGSEALLRWNHPVRGLVSPDQFISIAEDSGLIVEIGEWVLREACRTAYEWNGIDKPFHKMAINLSARQFQSGDLVKTIGNILHETGCFPEWIELEITESLLLDEQGDVLQVLEAFRSVGISIAIDDFGKGYSALSYLARFPINTLKIDRSFISAITAGGYQAELVKAIISIAHSLGQSVVAEGVETDEQAAYLHANGCQVAQGYLFSMPLSKPEFELEVLSFS
jgi:diguanylate cyclase (GGDEF)-like protein/PAS domain S-box-containing protein